MLKFLYGATPAEFKSAYGLEESVGRLQAATSRSILGSMSKQTAVGKVTASTVRLQRVIPMVGNSFKPFFFGRFEQRGADVFLTGRFTMNVFVKIFVTIWLGGVAVIGGPSALVSVMSSQTPAWAALTPLFMFAFGFGLIAVGKWFARNDVAWLSHVITTALSASTSAPAPTVPPRLGALAGRETPVPLTLRLAALGLLLIGVMSAVQVSSSVFSLILDPSGALIAQPLSPAYRTGLLACAVGALVLAVGVYRRQLWAWKLAFVEYAGITAITLLQGPAYAAPDTLEFKVFMAVCMAFVIGYWGRWWYAQRVHFLSGESP